jgi:hypothetical protein
MSALSINELVIDEIGDVLTAAEADGKGHRVDVAAAPANEARRRSRDVLCLLELL